MGLVEEEHLGLVRERAGDAEPLLLAARQSGAGRLQAVLDLVPQGRLRSARSTRSAISRSGPSPFRRGP